MNTLDLKCFCTAAEELNITHAAERLHLTQQALSSKIARLESSYGAQFFKRAPKLRLTRSGELFLAYARDAVEREEQVVAELAAESEERRGFLTFGITPSRSQTILPRLLPRFLAENERVRVKLEIASAPRLTRKLADGDLDLAVCLRQNDVDSDIEQIPVMNDELCLAIPSVFFEKFGQTSLLADSPSPQILQERVESSGLLARLPYVLSGPQARRIALKYLRSFVDEPNIMLELHNTETFFTLPLLSVGATFMFRSMKPFFSHFCNESEVKNAVFLPLGIPEALCEMCVCTCKRHPSTWSMRAFISLAMRELGGAEHLDCNIDNETVTPNSC